MQRDELLLTCMLLISHAFSCRLNSNIINCYDVESESGHLSPLSSRYKAINISLTGYYYYFWVYGGPGRRYIIIQLVFFLDATVGLSMYHCQLQSGHETFTRGYDCI